MASLPQDTETVLGRLDRDGRLIWADPKLAELQVQAGSRIGAALALPQIAAVARLASGLGIAVSRQASVAGKDRDYDILVNARPEGEEVALALEFRRERQAAGARLAGLVPEGREGRLAANSYEWAADEELRIMAVSPAMAELVGLEPSQAVGQPLTRLLKLEENDDGVLPLLSGLGGRSPFEGQRARPRGRPDQLLLLDGMVLEGRGGTFAGFKGRARLAEPAGDGQDARQAEGFAEIDDALDEALKSPLDRIIESADRMVAQAEGPLRSDYAEYAGDIASAARHLLAVVRSVAGEDGRPARIDMSALAADAVGLLESTARARSVALRLESKGARHARGDARAVVQILVNLIGNAIRHSPQEGSVDVSIEALQDHVAVHVSDRGPGIAAADQERIFERFEQAHEGPGGTGLGLAISRRLARELGGDIHLDSNPGEGARFTLQLPVATD